MPREQQGQPEIQRAGRADDRRPRTGWARCRRPGRRVTVAGVRLSVRHKLILFSTLAILVVSSGFTWVNLVLARRAIEEDLQNRAIVYAREVAAAIGGRRELETGPPLHQLIARLLRNRRGGLPLDVLP